MNQEPLKAMVTEGALKKWIKKSSWWWYYSWGMQRDWFSIGQVLWILFFFFSCTSVRFAFFFAYNQFVGPKISPGIDGDRVSSRFVTTWSACWRSADDLRIRVATARARQSASPGVVFKNGWHDMWTITNPSTSHFNRGIRRDYCCRSERPRAEMD